MVDNTNNLLSKYLNQYQRKPTSRVFAPLAESYRKIGMIDEALEVLRKGIKFHPDYQLAYLVLGNCYFDLQEFNKAYDVLKPMVVKNSDNLKLHQLYAVICEKLSYENEALTSYKAILFINPYDTKAAEKVASLEESEVVKQNIGVIKKESPQVSSELATDDEDWVAIDLSHTEEVEETIPEELTEEQEFDNWAMSKENLTQEEETPVTEPVLKTEEDLDELISGDEEPFVTHTLVDIYLAQRHYDKAQVLLEKIIENDPSDQKSKKKLNQILGKLGDQTDSYYKRVEEKYMEFLTKIRAKAEVYLRA